MVCTKMIEPTANARKCESKALSVSVLRCDAAHDSVWLRLLLDTKQHTLNACLVSLRCEAAHAVKNGVHIAFYSGNSYRRR